jgi:hypothetical protein
VSHEKPIESTPATARRLLIPRSPITASCTGGSHDYFVVAVIAGTSNRAPLESTALTANW